MTRLFRISLIAVALFLPASSARPQSAPEAIAFTHVAVVDPGGAATRRDQTVVVTGDRIAEIGRTGEVRIPPGASVVDATGTYLIPGLWDMHAHVFTHRGDAFFPLYAAAGVTGVRDMHTVVPMAQIQERRLLDRKALDQVLSRLEASAPQSRADQASSFRTTLPLTSVRRKSRPWKR